MDRGTRTAGERGCPSDEDLAAFLEHTLSRERCDELEAHFDRCVSCREAVGHVAATVGADAPKQIGRYRLDKQLGAGGMGVVWQAWDPALEREIAIKLLHPELHDAKGRERALREARALARLAHPNVVAVHDVGEHAGDVFIATELIDGESLDRWQRGRSPAEVIAAYAQAARGLAAAHALGLVHRDVKPSNILVGKDGRVRVGDFGLATTAAPTELERMLSPASSPGRPPLPKLTHDGERLGTPAYMAPEQQHSTAVDERADQFSLCLALAEALLGERPAAEPDVKALAASGVAAPWAAIARGLSARPGDRFPDLSPLVDALDGKQAPAAQPVWRARRVWIAGGITAAAMLGVAGWRIADTRSSALAPTPVAVTGSGDARVAPTLLPAPATPPAPWTWTTPPTGPWRLPTTYANSVAIADATHAVTATRTKLIVIDLTTGAVGAPVVVVPATSYIDSLVRVGDRVLAFGTNDDKPAAWSISISPPSATALTVPDPIRERPPVTMLTAAAAVVSPDAAHVIVCSSARWPTVRDAKTLAVIRVAKGEGCREPRFPDASHVVLGDTAQPRLLDLKTGTVTALSAHAPMVTAGPGGRVFSFANDRYKITSPSGVLRERRAHNRYEGIRWTPDGATVVGIRLGELTIRPANDRGIDREIPLPLSSPELAVDNSTAVVVADNVVLAIDLANGTVRHAEGSLQRIHQVAPRAGAVIVAADRLRLWREGKLVSTGDEARQFAVGAPASPITVLSFEMLGLWDPSTGERRVLRTLDGLLTGAVAQAGDAIVFSDRNTLYRSRGDSPPAPWFSFRDDLEVEAIDVPTGRIAWKANDVDLIVDTEQRTVWSVAVAGFDGGSCEAGARVRFAPGGSRFAIDAGAILLFDAATRVRLGELDLPKLMKLAWDFLPTGEMVVAGPTEIAIWDPRTQKAIGWKPPIQERPIELGIDAAGTELAIGYDDGRVLWADLAQLRAHATPRPSELKPSAACADRKLPEPRFDDLVAK